MPVLREQRRYITEGSVAAVRPATAMSGGFEALAEASARLSASSARMMGELAQDEATALAQSVRLDEDGNPHFLGGEDQRRRMGQVASRAFDATIRRRMGARIADQVRVVVEDARNQNPDNPDGFARDTRAALEGMRSTIPDEYVGVFQDSALEMTTRYGGQVGYAAGQRDRSRAADDFRSALLVAHETASGRALAGDMTGARAAMAELDGLGADLEEQGIVSPFDRLKARRTVEASIMVGTLHARGRTEDWSVEQFEAARLGLLRGDPAFTEGFPDRETQLQAAREMSPMVTHMDREARVQAEAARDSTATRLVLGGAADNTKPNRERLDAVLANVAGRPLTAEDWLNGAVQHDAVWSQMHASGMPAESLLGAFRMVGRGNVSPEQAEIAHRMWRELRHGRSPDGGPSDIAAHVDPDAVGVLEVMDAYMASAGLSPEAAFERARDMVAAGVDPEILSARLRDQTFSLGWFGGTHEFGAVTPDTARAALRGGVRAAVQHHLDSVPSRDELDRLTRVAELIVTSGAVSKVEDAIKMVVEQARHTAVETEFIYGGPGQGQRARSEFAPERHYVLPSERTILGMSVGGPNVDWFRGWTQDEIRRAVPGAMPEGRDLQPGRDYLLEPDLRATGRPEYFVMAAPDGDGIFQSVLDDDNRRVVLRPHDAWSAVAAAHEDRAKIDALVARARKLEEVTPTEMAKWLRDARRSLGDEAVKPVEERRSPLEVLRSVGIAATAMGILILQAIIEEGAVDHRYIFTEPGLPHD